MGVDEYNARQPSHPLVLTYIITRSSGAGGCWCWCWSEDFLWKETFILYQMSTFTWWRLVTGDAGYWLTATTKNAELTNFHDLPKVRAVTWEDADNSEAGNTWPSTWPAFERYLLPLLPHIEAHPDKLLNTPQRLLKAAIKEIHLCGNKGNLESSKRCFM